MNEFRADLHCHSTYSDGTATPQEIIQLARQNKLQGLSITDHDTIEAYKEAMPLAQTHQVALISGVEFSASHRQTSVHILAYSFALDSLLIRNFCLKHHQRRLKRNQMILDLLTARGMPLTLEDLAPADSPLAGFHTIGRPHIALALVKKGYVSSLQQAFNLYIGEGKSCYVAGEMFSVEETLALIHQAQGFAIIAHPHLINQTRLVKDLLEMDFDGLEGYYGRFSLKEQEPWVKIGQNKGWLVTGGSDFHGSIKPNLPLGSSWIQADTFNILQQRFQTNQQHASLS